MKKCILLVLAMGMALACSDSGNGDSEGDASVDTSVEQVGTDTAVTRSSSSDGMSGTEVGMSTEIDTSLGTDVVVDSGGTQGPSDMSDDTPTDVGSDIASEMPGDYASDVTAPTDVTSTTDVGGDISSDNVATDVVSSTDTGSAAVVEQLIVQIVEPEANRSFLVSESIDFRCVARYESGAPLVSPSYNWEILPAGLSLFGDRVTTAVPAGEQTVTCAVTDGSTGISGSAQATIFVGQAYVEIVEPDDGIKIPEESAGSSASEAIEFQAEGEGTDEEDGTYTWQINGVGTLLGDEVQTALPVGVHTVIVTFQDPAGNTATDQIQVEVVSLTEWQGCVAVEEICNGIDDNCNGEVDEGRISCGVGECVREVDRCVNGVDNVCVPEEPSPEECNNRDDDCDGSIDEHDGDILSLCEDDNRICADGRCERFRIPDESNCTQCPCDYCEDEMDMDLCCEIPGIGNGVICMDQDDDERCPSI